MPWKKARKLIKEDPRYKNYGDTDHVCTCNYKNRHTTAIGMMTHNNFSFQRREAEYDEYLKDRLVEAKNEFRALLKETKAISYRSYEMIKETDKHHKDIIDVLKVQYYFKQCLFCDSFLYRMIGDTLYWNA